MATVDLPGSFARLVREREARGLAATMTGRLGYVAVAAVMIPKSSPTLLDALVTLVACVVGIVVSTLGLWAARRRLALTLAGLVGVTFDVLTLWALPLSWYASVGGASVPRAFLAKSDVAFVAFAMISIHTLALRPLYPALLTAAAVLQQAALLTAGLLDPRTVVTYDPLLTNLGPGLHPVFNAWRGLTMLLVGSSLVWVAHIARRMIEETVRSEVETVELRAREAERLAAAKLSGLTGLVAGLTHELNTPVGALISGASSARRAAERIRERVAAASDLPALREDRMLERALGALDQTAAASTAAGARLGDVLGALARFTRLDETEQGPVDLAEGLRDAARLVPDDKRGRVTVVDELRPLPPVVGRARELHQVFLTLVENAFEAMGGEGTLHLRAVAMDGFIRLEIEDTGPGVPIDRRPDLFELGFKPRQRRMGMGLGLPVGRKVVLEHGGDLRLEDTVSGRGARFVVTLPLGRQEVGEEHEAPRPT